MNFLTPSATCPHCPGNVLGMSCYLRQTFLKASAVRTASGRQAEATGNVSGQRGADAELYTSVRKLLGQFPDKTRKIQQVVALRNL